MKNLTSILLASLMTTSCTTIRERSQRVYTTSETSGEINGYSFKVRVIKFGEGIPQEQIYLEANNSSQYITQISARLNEKKVTSLTLTAEDCETIVVLNNEIYEPDGCTDLSLPEIEFALQKIEEVRIKRDERIQ